AFVDLDLDVDGYGTARGQSGQGRVQPTVGQHRGVDAAHQLTKVGERGLRLLVRLDEELLGRLRGLVVPGPGDAEVHGERDQALLRAVVQVAFDPAPLR